MLVGIQRIFCTACDKLRVHEIVSELAKCVVCEVVQHVGPDTVDVSITDRN